MASRTAYYNLRKDASTDNYDVAVVNQNLDDIDAQMHQNEVASTTPFTGASSSVNGEKGIVPRPMAGDENKVLYGDGTWKPVQGGGGSTVTITPTLATGRKIAEYEIDGTNGSLFAPLVEITGEASGSIATFTDGADGKPVKNLEISIIPVQSGSGDPSPENDRPISGWSGANVTKCGVNIWDEEWELGGISNTTGQNITNNSTIRTKNYIPVVPNTRYYINSSKWQFVSGYDADKNFVGTVSYTSSGTGYYINVPSNVHYIRIPFSTTYGTTYNNDISINYPSTDTKYHAYNGSTTSIPFHDSSDNPITVYGGTLNVTSGELRVTHANIASYNGETINEPWISSMDVYSAGATPTTGAQVVYPLATPQTYQLTPTQVSTLLGQNNLFADCGDVEEVVYVRDINLAFNQLEERVAALEGNNSRSVSVSLTKSAPIEETKEEVKEEEPKDEIKEEEEKR